MSARKVASQDTTYTEGSWQGPEASPGEEDWGSAGEPLRLEIRESRNDAI
jgi:hypothetical protein